MNTALLAAATAAEPEVWAGVSPYVVGGVMLAFFLAVLAVLLMFGAGREHS